MPCLRFCHEIGVKVHVYPRTMALSGSGEEEFVGFWRLGSHLFLGRSSSSISQRKASSRAWLFFRAIPVKGAVAKEGLIDDGEFRMHSNASQGIVQVPQLRQVLH